MATYKDILMQRAAEQEQQRVTSVSACKQTQVNLLPYAHVKCDACGFPLHRTCRTANYNGKDYYACAQGCFGAVIVIDGTRRVIIL